eukprot:7223-Heterococcus_DN1.PRE.5
MTDALGIYVKRSLKDTSLREFAEKNGYSFKRELGSCGIALFDTSTLQWTPTLEKMVVLLAQGVKCLKADWLVECAAAGHMLDTTRFEITPKIKFNKDTGSQSVEGVQDTGDAFWLPQGHVKLGLRFDLCDELDTEKKIVLVPVVEEGRGTIYQPHQGRQAGPTLGQITSSRTPSRRKPVPTPPRITGSGTSRMFK